MVRKVIAIPSGTSAGTPDVKARMSDTYVRPAVQGEGTIENIAEALVRVNPNIAKYLERKQEEKDDFDLATGGALARRFQEQGKDIPVKEIQEMVNRGEVEGFRHLNKMQKQGIIQERYKLAANTLDQKMLVYGSTGTVIDDDGKEVPISSLHDTHKAMLAFNKKAEEYLKEITKGKYDPVLYKDLIEPKLNEARQRFIQITATRNVEAIDTEYKNLSSQAMDSVAIPMFISGEAVKNPEIFTQTLANTLAQEAEKLQSRGMTKIAAMGHISQWLQSKFKDNNMSAENIIAMLDVANAVPGLMDDAKTAETINDSYNSGLRSKLALTKYLNDAQEDKLKAKTDDFLSEHARTGFKDLKAIQQYAYKNPTASADIFNFINSWQKAQKIMVAANVEMEPERFNQLLISARRGGLSLRDLPAYAEQLSPDQWNDLQGEASDTVRRGKALGSASAGRAIKDKEYNAYMKLALNTADPRIQLDLKDKSNSGAASLHFKVAEEGANAYRAWEERNPNAGPFSKKEAQEECMRKVWQRYKGSEQGYISGGHDVRREEPAKVRQAASKNKWDEEKEKLSPKMRRAVGTLLKNIPNTGPTDEQVETYIKLLPRKERTDKAKAKTKLIYLNQLAHDALGKQKE